MVVYGTLTGVNPSFDAYDLRWSDKNITSFVLYRWLASLTPEVRESWFKLVVDDLQHKDGAVFGSTVIKEVELS